METRSISRREFLILTALSGTAWVVGCATNPVTGRKEFILVSEGEEIRLDQQLSPHQFSADYGVVRDAALNRYLTEIGAAIAERSHRPHMPFSFRAVHASHVNAYAFPGGSIAVTRGILLTMDSEAELAALLGHEIGHVTARHAARSMTGGLLVQVGLALATAAASRKDEDAGALVAGLGGIGAGALLARYSRAHEREADALGMEYMVRAGYNPQGMVDLQDRLRKLSKNKPNVIELMFSTHPMSEERYQTAVRRASSEYASAAGLPMKRERYQDHLASLRAIQPAIEAIQRGDQAVAKRNLPEALAQYDGALRHAPEDYEALCKAAKVCLAMERKKEARSYIERARAAYPEEAQARHLEGMLGIAQKQFGEALAAFEQYERLLPGNPYTQFYMGYCLDELGRREEAAEKYRVFLQSASSGPEAEYAANRLAQWGKR